MYPGKSLILLCSRSCLELGKATGYFDRCVTVGELGGISCDLLIQTVFAKTRLMDVVAASIPAKEKISIKPDNSRVNLSRHITLKGINDAGDAVYDSIIDTGSDEMMELNRNAAFIRALGNKGFQSSMPEFPKMVISDGIVPESDYFVIFPGASSRRKSWPAERFAVVLDSVCKDTGMKCLICGAQSEQYLYEKILAASDTAPDRTVDYFGRTSLIELMEVIRHAKLLIGNDTSGIHFAAAVGTPCVCIAGDFIYGRFIPYDPEIMAYSPVPVVVHAGKACAGCALSGRTLKCRMAILLKNRFECISDVSIDMVIEAVNKLLDVQGVSADGI